MPTHANQKNDHLRDELSMIFKAVSRTGSLGSCFVSMDIGSKRLAMQNFQISERAETNCIKVALIISLLRPWPCWLLPSPQKQEQKAISGGEWTFGVAGAAERNWEHFSSAASLRAELTSPDGMHRPRDLGILQRDIRFEKKKKKKNADCVLHHLMDARRDTQHPTWSI